MFRYLCLAWDLSDTPRSLQASALAAIQEQCPGWRAASRQPGLHVYTIGDRAESNQVYTLYRGRGLVLGKLFRRASGLSSPPCAPIDLNDEETSEILDTEGARLVGGYWGRYIALLQGCGGKLTVVRDPTGTLPCLVLQHEGVWIVASWLEDALALIPAALHPRPDLDGVRAYLLFGTPTGPRTALKGVEQVLPGERVELQRDRLERQLVWNPIEFANRGLQLTASEAARALRETVQACVHQWASVYDRIVLRLSGGVDSSILAGCLAAGQVDAEVLCLNFRWTDPSGDERSYASLAARKAQRRLTIVEAETDVRLEELLDLPRLPWPRASVTAITMARIDASVAAAFGAGAMFTGAAGDVVFYEVPRWWPAADYLRQRGIDAGFPSAVLDAAHLGGVSVWHVLAMVIRERFRPAAEVLRTGEDDGLFSQQLRLDPDAVAQFRHPLFERSRALPVGKAHQLQQLLNLPNYYEPLALHTAPEPVHPLLSQPVVELALGLPTYLLTQGGRGRALARSAFSSLLPAEIAQRRMKGATTQAIKDILFANLPWARDLILEGELSRLGLLDRRRVEQLLSPGPEALTASAWSIQTLIEVESWLRCWSRTAAHPQATGINI